MVQQILIRADDLGYCEAVNYGIAKTVREGIVRSVGVMPNMPAAMQGISLLEGCDVCLGQHTNICVGRALYNSLVANPAILRATPYGVRTFLRGWRL